MIRRLKKWGIILTIIYLSLTIFAYFFQERLIFFPSRMPMNHEFDFCQPYEELYLKASDGAVINGVHIKHENAKGVVVYFHGNSGNISHLIHVANMFTKFGYESILVDYRTYGKSTGELSEQAIYEDAKMFYDYANEMYEENNIIVYGRSFGTGVASYLAAKKNPKKLILESPFYSAVDLGKHRFPFLPVNWLSNFRFPSNEYLKKVNCEVFIFHGKEDFVVPYDASERLYELIESDKKHLITIQEGGHNYLQDFPEFKSGMQSAMN